MNEKATSFKKYYMGVLEMKDHFKMIILSLCMLLIPFSAGYGAVNGLIYVLLVKAPHALYIPTLEFEAGNSLIVIGASYQYGELTGRWQEAPLGTFSFFQAQVEESVTSTTTTTPEIPQIPGTLGQMDSSALQPAESDKTKFLINLAGFSFTPLAPFNNFSILLGSGAYLGAEVVFTGFSATTGEASCSSVDPNSGTQGQTNLQIDLVGQNTNFVENLTAVTFSGTDITVSGVTVLNATNLSFNIEIGEFAAVGPRDVIVTVADPLQIVTCAQAFTVTAP